MTLRSTIAHLVAAALCVGLLFAAAPARAGGTLIVVNPGGNDTPLALPKPQTDGVDASVADELWSVIDHDLVLTGYFNIIDPNAYIEQGKGVEPGSFNFDDWRVVKATALAKTRITSMNGGYRADVFIYDVGAGVKIDAHGYQGAPADVRYLGHRIADAILLALTGQPGFFGSRIAVVGNKTGHKEIYVMDIDGQGVQAVTSNGTINLSPAWSPTGDRIAFTSYKRDNADVYVKELKTGRVFAASAKSGVDSGAAFSPDGTKIALSRSNGNESDIYIVDAATGADLQRVTNVTGIDVAPSWSPDGTKLVYASERSGGSQIFLQDLASGAVTRVSMQGSFNSDPVWSPEGDRIAFVGRDGKFDIFVVNLDGTGIVRVTQDQGDNEDPCWSHDGRYLMFSSTRNGKEQIWLSTVDGRYQQPVTASGGWSQPSWGP